MDKPKTKAILVSQILKYSVKYCNSGKHRCTRIHGQSYPVPARSSCMNTILSFINYQIMKRCCCWYSALRVRHHTVYYVVRSLIRKKSVSAIVLTRQRNYLNKLGERLRGIYCLRNFAQNLKLIMRQSESFHVSYRFLLK